MAWSQIQSKGPKAPCSPPNCNHKDCAEMVKIIRTDCTLCGEPIRYEKFSRDDRGELAHFICLLKLAEAERQS